MRQCVSSFFILAFCLSALPTHAAPSGGVIVDDGVLLWGQYRQMKNVIGVEPPQAVTAQNPASEYRHYPFAGASTVLLRCQRANKPFFTPDGGIESSEALETIRRNVEAVYRFDMLPIVVLFDPGAPRLSSQDAYVAAAKNIVQALGGDYYFLLCISDQCDASEWGGVDVDAAVKAIAEAVHGMNPRQALAAGAVELAANARLMKMAAGWDEKSRASLAPGIHAIVRRSNGFSAVGHPEFNSDLPWIDVVTPEFAAAEPSFTWAIATVFGKELYGFVVDYNDVSAAYAQYVGFLETLHERVDAYQKAATGAKPIDPGTAVSLKPGESDEGFVSLFNGTDLAGWVPLCVPGNFVVHDGVIRLVIGPGGWLRSWDSYSDYTLRAEYRIVEGGNNGIYNRAPLVGRQSRIGFEFQVQGQPAELPPSIDSTGSIYDVRPPDENRMKPGQWNEVEITCQGEHVRIVWNGKVVHDFDYVEVERMHGRATRGYIGLQDHHNTVEYRNLRVKRLD